ncbi:MAG: HPr family phosphocarrier protein [Acidobacteriota bacterium]
MQQRTIIITNRLGLHARAAAKLVKLVSSFESDIFLAPSESPHKTVDARSIFNVLLLAAAKDASIEIVAEGADEEAAIEAMCRLVASKFGEE